MDFLPIFLIIIFVLILFFFIIYFFLYQNTNKEEDVLNPTPSNIEILQVDGNATVVNHVVRDIGIKIAQGPFITVDTEGNLRTSWHNSREWVCQGLRIHSIHYTDLALTVEKLDTENNLITVSLQPYIEGNPLQQFYYTGEKILLYNTQYKITLQGLAVSKTTEFTKTFATFTREDLTIEETINFNGTIYPINNLVEARFQPDYIVVDYYTVAPTSMQSFIWNSGLRRITSSFGGVLSLESEGPDVVNVLYVEPDNTDKKKDVVVIDKYVYFIGSNPDYCYLVLNNMSAIKIDTAFLVEETTEITDKLTLTL